MFRFRLQRVLDFRRLREGQIEQELQRIHHQLREEERQLETLEAEALHQQEQFYAAQGRAMQGEELRIRWRHYELLERHIAAQKVRIAEVMEARGSKLQELIEARQEKSVIEKIEEKAKKEYIRSLAKREQQLLNDLAITRARHER